MRLDPGSSFLQVGRLTVSGAITGRPDAVAVIDDAWIGGQVALRSGHDLVEFPETRPRPATTRPRLGNR